MTEPVPPNHGQLLRRDGTSVPVRLSEAASPNAFHIKNRDGDVLRLHPGDALRIDALDVARSHVVRD